MKDNKISTDSYKGVRDFYPEDMFVLRYITDKMREVVESFGYQEYTASPLEPSELYHAKNSEEIVNEQTYNFIDRGGRSVTLRPEMTPTIARMVAKKRRDLSLPIRLYSIPNVFRYEQPQRGRLREHYQLNVDIFGVKGVEAEIELITVGKKIMQSLKAKDDDYEIRINSRKLFKLITKSLDLSDEDSLSLARLLDKKEKLERLDFETKLKELIGHRAENLIRYISSQDLGTAIEYLDEKILKSEAFKELENLMLGLSSNGVSNAKFYPSLMRGFDYYTGIIFEFFDTNKENNRSLFGGGRYDELMDIFGEEKVPTAGFGMGDVTAKDFLETHNLIPKYVSKTDLYICLFEDTPQDYVNNIATELRRKGINVAVDYSFRKLGDQIKSADKSKIKFVAIIGLEEARSKIVNIKNIQTGETHVCKLAEIANFIK